MRIEILLAGEYRLVRETVRLVLEQDPHLHVVGEARDTDRVKNWVEQVKPHVILLALPLPGWRVGQSGAEIYRVSPRSALMLLSPEDRFIDLTPELKTVAVGYVRSTSPPASLIEGIYTVSAGRRYGEVPDTLVHRADSATLRECQVLQLAAWGCRDREIAAALGISHRTVEVHKHNAMTKLRLSGRAALVRHAIEQGWYQPKIDAPDACRRRETTAARLTTEHRASAPGDNVRLKRWILAVASTFASVRSGNIRPLNCHERRLPDDTHAKPEGAK